jgi:chromosomal replication initiation ATPase DnaA
MVEERYCVMELVNVLKCECCGQEMKTMAALESAYYAKISGEPMLKDIIRIVEEETGYGLRSLRSWSRRKEKTNALKLVSKLALTYTKHSASSVGRALNRDHTTIIHHYKSEIPKEVEQSHVNCIMKITKMG